MWAFGFVGFILFRCVTMFCHVLPFENGESSWPGCYQPIISPMKYRFKSILPRSDASKLGGHKSQNLGMILAYGIWWLAAIGHHPDAPVLLLGLHPDFQKRYHSWFTFNQEFQSCNGHVRFYMIHFWSSQMGCNASNASNWLLVALLSGRQRKQKISEKLEATDSHLIWSQMTRTIWNILQLIS